MKKLKQKTFSGAVKLLVPLMLVLALTSTAPLVYAYLPVVSLGTDPKGDVFPPKPNGDILECYFTNDGTHLRLIMRLDATPNTQERDYHVFLDTKDGTSRSPAYADADYCLDSHQGTLWKWNPSPGGGHWEASKGAVEVSVSGYNISLTCKLTDIQYPEGVSATVGIVFVTYNGVPADPPAASILDRAPDTGAYYLAHEVIPELPWPTPLVFIPALIVTVYITYTRRFRQRD